MAQRILAENASIDSVSYSLPNKHYIPVDMKYIGIDNLTPCVYPQTFCFQTIEILCSDLKLKYSARLPHPGMHSYFIFLAVPGIECTTHSGLINATVSRK